MKWQVTGNSSHFFMSLSASTPIVRGGNHYPRFVARSSVGMFSINHTHKRQTYILLNNMVSTWAQSWCGGQQRITARLGISAWPHNPAVFRLHSPFLLFSRTLSYSMMLTRWRHHVTAKSCPILVSLHCEPEVTWPSISWVVLITFS